MNKRVVKSNAFLLLAAAIWGLAFVAQSDGMNYIGPFTFCVARSILGAVAVFPVWLIMSRKEAGRYGRDELIKKRKATVKAGLICGTALFAATAAQQIGIQYTTAGKAGFITALYIVMVPILGMIFFKRKAPVTAWLSVVLATAGLYLLCIKEGFTVSKGDLWVIVCAVLFGFQILFVDRYAPEADGVLLSCVQFLVVAVLSVPGVFINGETVTVQAFSGAWRSVCYTGIFSSGVAYTLQILGQKNSENPTVASLLMSMESVFAAVFGWLILHERLERKELAGVLIMALAIILSQLPVKSLSAFRKDKV